MENFHYFNSLDWTKEVQAIFTTPLAARTIWENELCLMKMEFLSREPPPPEIKTCCHWWGCKIWPTLVYINLFLIRLHLISCFFFLFFYLLLLWLFILRRTKKESRLKYSFICHTNYMTSMTTAAATSVAAANFQCREANTHESKNEHSATANHFEILIET